MAVWTLGINHTTAPVDLRGRWHEAHFKNNNPITLELACGGGEYFPPEFVLRASAFGLPSSF